MSRSDSATESVEAVRFPVNSAILSGDLHVPSNAVGIVLFAHGSGSGRHSPRNQYVAQRLRDRELATLLFDLLTEREEQLDLHSGRFRFDIELLTDRLVGATDWLLH